MSAQSSIIVSSTDFECIQDNNEYSFQYSVNLFSHEVELVFHSSQGELSGNDLDSINQILNLYQNEFYKSIENILPKVQNLFEEYDLIEELSCSVESIENTQIFPENIVINNQNQPYSYCNIEEIYDGGLDLVVEFTPELKVSHVRFDG